LPYYVKIILILIADTAKNIFLEFNWLLE